MDQLHNIEIYFNEQDPEKRKSVLEEIVSQNPDSIEWKKRREIFMRRFPQLYGRKKDAKDEYLYSWMLLISAGYNRTAFFKSGMKKDIKRALTSFGMYDETPDEIDRQELYDMAQKYIRVSLSSKQYGTYILGMINMPDRKVAMKLCGDVFMGAYDGLAGYGYSDESEYLLGIFKEVFEDIVEDGGEIWQAYIDKRKKDERS